MNRLIDKSLLSIRQIWHDPEMRDFLLAGVTSLFIKVASAGLTFTMFVLIARVMNIEQFGIFSFQFNLATFLCFIAGFGLHNAILRWLPEYIAANAGNIQVAVFCWSVRVTLIGCVSTIALSWLGFYIVRMSIPSITEVTLVSLLLVIPLAFAELMGAAIRSRGKVVSALFPKDIVWRLIVIAFCAFLMVNDRSVTPQPMIVFMTTSLSLLIILQLVFYWRIQPSASDIRVTSGLQSKWIATATPIWLTGIIISLTQYMDVILVGLFLAPRDTAIYFTATRIAGLMSMLLIASNMVCAPIIAKLQYAGDTQRLQTIMRYNAVAIAIPTACALALIIVFGRWIMNLFTDGFSEGYIALIILSFGYAINAFAGPMSYVLQLTGYERDYLKVMIVCYGAVVVFQIAMMPLLGINGAAAGTALGFLAWNLWSRRIARRNLGLDPTLLGLIVRTDMHIER